MAAKPPDDMDPYGLLLAFDTDNPAFARGFEAGRLWAMLRGDESELVATVSATNAEMLMRMAESTGRTVRGEELGDGWVEVVFSEADGTPAEEAM